jgi:hypothetical protein
MSERSSPGEEKKSKRVIQKSDWTGLYTREIIVFAMFFLFVPVVGGTSKLLGSAFLPIALVWMSVWLGAGVLLGRWRCPNCSKRYLTNERTTVHMPFRLRCANCGISLGYTNNRTA